MGSAKWPKKGKPGESAGVCARSPPPRATVPGPRAPKRPTVRRGAGSGARALSPRPEAGMLLRAVVGGAVGGKPCVGKGRRSLPLLGMGFVPSGGQQPLSLPPSPPPLPPSAVGGDVDARGPAGSAAGMVTGPESSKEASTAAGLAMRALRSARTRAWTCARAFARVWGGDHEEEVGEHVRLQRRHDGARILPRTRASAPTPQHKSARTHARTHTNTPTNVPNGTRIRTSARIPAHPQTYTRKGTHARARATVRAFTCAHRHADTQTRRHRQT